MSSLRRRIFGAGTPDSTPSSSRDVSPAPVVGTPGESEDYKIVRAKELEKLNKHVRNRKGSKKRNAWIFGLGGLFGLLAAGFFATPQSSIDKLIDVAGLSEMNLDSILDALPAGLIRDVQDMQVGSIVCISQHVLHPLSPLLPKLMVDQGVFDRRAMRKKPSTMTPSPSVFMPGAKAFDRNIPSS